MLFSEDRLDTFIKFSELWLFHRQKHRRLEPLNRNHHYSIAIWLSDTSVALNHLPAAIHGRLESRLPRWRRDWQPHDKARSLARFRFKSHRPAMAFHHRD